MKSSLATLLVLNILILAGVLFLILGPLGTRLERIEGALKTSDSTRNRISGMVHQNQGAITNLTRMLRNGSISMKSQDDASGNDASPESSNPTNVVSDPDLSLLDEIESLERKRMEHAETGIDSESFNSLVDSKISEFVSRGAPALSHLPERLRVQRDVDVRRFYLTSVLPRFENLDPMLCYEAAQMIFLDGAADPSLRRESLDLAYRFNREKAEAATTDILRTIKRPAVQAAMLKVLSNNPSQGALDLILSKAKDPKEGEQVQSQAVQTLSRYPGSKTVEGLRDIIENQSQFLQSIALDSLAHVEGKDALPYLRKLKSDADEDEAFPSAVMRKIDSIILKLESEDSGE